MSLISSMIYIKINSVFLSGSRLHVCVFIEKGKDDRE